MINNNKSLLLIQDFKSANDEFVQEAEKLKRKNRKSHIIVHKSLSQKIMSPIKPLNLGIIIYYYYYLL